MNSVSYLFDHSNYFYQYALFENDYRQNVLQYIINCRWKLFVQSIITECNESKTDRKTFLQISTATELFVSWLNISVMVF